MKFNFTSLLSFTIVTFLYFSGFAQSDYWLSDSNNYRIANIYGNAKYQYSKTSKNLIFNGFFNFTAYDNSLTITGSYNNNLKINEWIYTENHFFTSEEKQYRSTSTLSEKYENSFVFVKQDYAEFLIPDGSTDEQKGAIVKNVIHCIYNEGELQGNYFQSIDSFNTHFHYEIKGEIQSGLFTGSCTTQNEKNGNIHSTTLSFYKGCLIITQNNENQIIKNTNTELIDSLVSLFLQNPKQGHYSLGNKNYTIKYGILLSTPSAQYENLTDNLMFSESSGHFLTVNAIEDSTNNSQFSRRKLTPEERRKHTEMERKQKDAETQAQVEQISADMQSALLAAQQEEERKKNEEQNRKIIIDQLKKQIIDKHAIIQKYCEDKKNKIIAKSYQTIISNCNVLLTDNSEDYKNNLQEYLDFQNNLYENIFTSSKVEHILNQYEQIDKSSNKIYPDLYRPFNSAFKKFNFTPIFQNITEYYTYINFLDYVITLENNCMTIIEKRNQISETDKTINKQYIKYLNKLFKSYNLLRKKTQFSCSFTSIQATEQLIQSLELFSKMQNKYLTLIQQRITIENNAVVMNTSTPKFSHIVKAHNYVVSQYNLSPVFSTTEEADTFIQAMSELIQIQEQFIYILKIPSVTVINKKLKKQKDINTIKQIIGM